MIQFVFRLGIGLFLLLGASAATAQVVKVQLDSDADSLSVRQGTWRFRAGDGKDWTSPAYDDQRWDKQSPTIDISDNTALWKTGKGCFRTTIRVRQPITSHLLMSIRQFGASTVYLDGRQVAVLRPFKFDRGGSQRIVQFTPIQLADTNQHTLAVRYAFRRDPMIGREVDKEPFHLDFGLDDRVVANLLDADPASSGVDYALVGLFGVLSLLHGLFYRANPAQRVNLLLAMTMLAFALIFLSDQINEQAGTLTISSAAVTFLWLMTNIAFGLLLLSVYTYLGRKPGWIFWSLILVLTLSVLYHNFIATMPGDVAWIPFALVLTEYVRVSWVAKRRNPDRAARLPWNSIRFALYSLLAIIVLTIGTIILAKVLHNNDFLDWIKFPANALGIVALFSIPVGLSFSLVIDYARTHQSLKEQFNAVNRLSAQTLAQEQEKQLLLARQNEVLEKQVADRTGQLNQSLTELRATQTQLIQREKLASLGELTAGIAHEIQNPLNFVTNFSEVSAELVAELTAEAENPARDKDLEADLLTDLTLNLEKITHHGRRASAIVRGMLEHSRSIAGERQPTDLNALFDEYLTLAYHGVRTKEPAFTATLTKQFDAGLDPVPVVAQEIGRVLLNLFSNAFYALHKRQQTDEPGYEPTIQVSTERTGNAIVLRIWDNGTGIPAAAQAKVFQPFFTTKPTGEGTGLGLSLSYDIITKGYGGTMVLDTQEHEFTAFTITLPLA